MVKWPHPCSPQFRSNKHSPFVHSPAGVVTFSRQRTCDCQRPQALRILPTVPAFIGTPSIARGGGEQFRRDCGPAPMIRADGPEKEPASSGTANVSEQQMHGAQLGNTQEAAGDSSVQPREGEKRRRAAGRADEAAIILANDGDAIICLHGEKSPTRHLPAEIARRDNPSTR